MLTGPKVPQLHLHPSVIPEEMKKHLNSFHFILDAVAAQHDIQLIPIQKINEAYDRVVLNDGKYRFVIDMASLKRS